MTTINLVELLSACVSVAKLAGKEICRISNTDNIVAIGKDSRTQFFHKYLYTCEGQKTNTEVSKQDVEGGADAVTQADIAAQQIIEGTLKHMFPGIRLIGEEDIDPKDYKIVDADRHLFDSITPESADFQAQYDINDVIVYVDPLDATQEFILGNKFCTICLIGIVVKNEPIGGVMYQPFEGQGRLLWALRGFGAGDDSPSDYNILKRRGAPKQDQTEESKFIIATSRIHSYSELTNSLEKIKDITKDVIRIGGAGYKVLLLLEGKADVYFYPIFGTKSWDTAAPEAILRYFGGVISDKYGNPLTYGEVVQNEKGVIASITPHIHSKVIEALNR